jgi:hypothetical protein
VGYGLVLVIGASIALAAAGVARGLELMQAAKRPASST